MSEKLHSAVQEISGLTGLNAATLASVTQKFVTQLAARWEHICDVALSEENEGKVNVGFAVKFDMTHKVPVGVTRLSFATRVCDEDTFSVEDPDQMAIPLAQPALAAPATLPPTRRRQARTNRTSN